MTINFFFFLWVGCFHGYYLCDKESFQTSYVTPAKFIPFAKCPICPCFSSGPTFPYQSSTVNTSGQPSTRAGTSTSITPTSSIPYVTSVTQPSASGQASLVQAPPLPLQATHSTPQSTDQASQPQVDYSSHEVQVGDQQPDLHLHPPPVQVERVVQPMQAIEPVKNVQPEVQPPAAQHPPVCQAVPISHQTVRKYRSPTQAMAVAGARLVNAGESQQSARVEVQDCRLVCDQELQGGRERQVQDSRIVYGTDVLRQKQPQVSVQDNRVVYGNDIQGGGAREDCTRTGRPTTATENSCTCSTGRSSDCTTIPTKCPISSSTPCATDLSPAS